jgi:hypothetical protein
MLWQRLVKALVVTTASYLVERALFGGRRRRQRR